MADIEYDPAKRAATLAARDLDMDRAGRSLTAHISAFQMSGKTTVKTDM
jgi:hypothetical protein